MRFGFYLPQGQMADPRHDVTLVAREAERIGYDSLWVFERVLFPLNPADGMYGVPGLAWADLYRHTADPLTVLTLAAAVTENVRLGTGVLVAGLHQPHSLARTMATLDQLSGGRAVLGLGGGWSSDEFRAAGADFRHRGRSLAETIDACRALWGPNPVSHRDSRMVVDNALVTPKPLTGIPILLGGGSTDVALDRIARKADGWMPSGLGPGAVADRWEQIRDRAAGHGRNPAELELYSQVRPQGSTDQVVSDLAAYAEAGTDEALIVIVDARTAEEMVDRAAELMTAVTEAGLRD